jgi:hypothetical protein
MAASVGSLRKRKRASYEDVTYDPEAGSDYREAIDREARTIVEIEFPRKIRELNDLCLVGPYVVDNIISLR